MPLTITLTIAAACTLVNLWLALRITRRRLSGDAVMGDGGQPLLLARMRAHANFTEYAPFVLILMGAIELSGGWRTGLWIVGVVFVLARLAHPIGMEWRTPSNAFRAGGALVTWIVLAILAGWALAIVYGASGGATPKVITSPSCPRAARRLAPGR